MSNSLSKSSIVNLGLVQTRCSSDVAANMQHSLSKAREAAEMGAQIICLPEMYRTEYFCRNLDHAHFALSESIPGPSTEIFAALAKEKEVVIILPLFEKRADGLYHNTVAVIDADGSLAGIYRKMHIPHDPGFEEKFYFAPGDLGFKVFETRYGKVGTLICWDQWYPEAARITAMMGADFLFYPTAIGWMDEEPDLEERRLQIEAWETMQRAHAIANGLFVCTVNRTGRENNLQFWGNSFVFNPIGACLAKTSHEQEEVVVVSCDLAQKDQFRTTWPFFRDRRIDAYQDLTQRWIS